MIFCFIMSNKSYEGEPHVFGASYVSFHSEFPHLRTSSVNMASIAFIFSSCHCTDAYIASWWFKCICPFFLFFFFPSGWQRRIHCHYDAKTSRLAQNQGIFSGPWRVQEAERVLDHWNVLLQQRNLEGEKEPSLREVVHVAPHESASWFGVPPRHFIWWPRPVDRTTGDEPDDINAADI